MPYDRLLSQPRTGVAALVITPTPTPLVNGANNNVPARGVSLLRIAGPTGAFTTTGFTDGVGGKVLVVQNTTAFAWTIANQNAGSAVENRIITLTGANVVLAASQSVATFVYDAVQHRWVLTAARDSAGAH